MTRVQVLDFYADWCQPCKQISKILPHLEKSIAGIGTVEKINVEESADMATKFNVRSIPTFVITNDGEEVKRFVGVTSLAVIEQTVKDIHKENGSGC